MGLVFADRVRETSVTSGTGTLNLAGAVQGFQTFVSGVGTAAIVRYAIADQGGANWEVGEGTVTSGSPDTLSRDTIWASSNSGNAVNFGSNTKDVMLVLMAQTVTQVPTIGNTLALASNIVTL
jgi:hypothetical protein